MEVKLSVKALAEKIVLLIENREQAGLEEALAILNSHYPTNPKKIAKAYEVACLVALKRFLDRERPAQGGEVSPDADWLAMRASRAASEGDVNEAFSLLRIANRSGARRSLCRSVVFQMLRGIRDSDRVTEIRYTATEVTAIEVGRVSDSGFILLQNSGSPRRSAPTNWRDFVRSDEAKSEIILRSNAEIKKDVADGMVEYSKTGASSATLGRINWSKYILSLSRALKENLHSKKASPLRVAS